ncbi:hypothetical protein C8Q78DRAFT_998473 [Trametes maxima]|nr:hypothetical protein C8Q78DRAFT_998473 [Trametes maxima]
MRLKPKILLRFGSLVVWYSIPWGRRYHVVSIITRDGGVECLSVTALDVLLGRVWLMQSLPSSLIEVHTENIVKCAKRWHSDPQGQKISSNITIDFEDP